MEKLLCRIYEDHILGRIPDEHCQALSAAYEKEKSGLQQENDNLGAEIAEASVDTDRANKFIALIEKYENFDELTNPMLLELVNKAVVHERDKKHSQEYMQEIEIYFNFVSKFISPDFEREIAAFKERQHYAYRRRKESDRQAKYEAKIKAEKKAR